MAISELPNQNPETAENAGATPDVAPGTAYVSWQQMHDFMMDVFQAYGVPKADAEICTDVLMESDRRGIASHGINRFKPIYLDRIKNGTLLPVTNVEILRETPTTLVMDAHDGMGMVASYQMMTRLIEKAKAYGMAGGAIRNSTHYGIAGYWVTMATHQGLIGITGTNARPSIAPTFGVENMLGTNPLTIGLPTDEPFPFVIDCATSISQRGKIERYAREGLDTPAGMVVGRDGSAMTDSPAILEALVAGEAALAPLGGIGEDLAGYKGYGYATVVEILSAALAGGSFMKDLTGVDAEGKPRMYGLGHFFFVMDPDAFMGADTFKKIAGDICRELRASEKAPGAERIYTAGEKEYLCWLDRKDKGVPVEPALQREIVGIRDELGLGYTFDFEAKTATAVESVPSEPVVMAGQGDFDATVAAGTNLAGAGFASKAALAVDAGLMPVAAQGDLDSRLAAGTNLAGAGLAAEAAHVLEASAVAEQEEPQVESPKKGKPKAKGKATKDAKGKGKDGGKDKSKGKGKSKKSKSKKKCCGKYKKGKRCKDCPDR